MKTLLVVCLLSVSAVAGNAVNPETIDLEPIPVPVESTSDMDRPVALPASAFALMEPATPESQGVSSAAILKWIDACEKTFDAGPDGALHGFVIVRHGKVIAEGSWKPFDTLNETHMLYSHSKSFTSSAIGFLVDEGKVDLDERLVDILPEDVPAKPDPRLGEIRVRDLLTMNVGADGDHTIGRNPSEWTKWFMKKELQRRPGTGFRYDSDATYMLAAIVEKKSGEKMMDYLKRKMFDRIGITKAWSTCSPEGIPCGGWGMNMTTRELARFGQLYLNHGEWDGEQLLSPDWVSLATTRQTWCGGITIQSQTIGSGSDWSQGYGFQFWRCRHGAYRADGAGGQYTIVFPDADAVVSIHAGLGDMQKELNLVWDHLLPEFKTAALPENPSAQGKLADRLANLEIPPVRWLCSYPQDWQKKFVLKENSRGFKSVSFESKDNEVRCTLMTRVGEQSFPIGNGKWLRGKIRIDPEDYEGLGAYIGDHKTAASYGYDKDGSVRIRAYLTGDTGYLDFKIRNGKLTGEFWAMGGCKLESK